MSSRSRWAARMIVVSRFGRRIERLGLLATGIGSRTSSAEEVWFVLFEEVMRRSAGIYIDAVRQGTRLAWRGASFTLEQMQRVFSSSGEPEPGMNDATLKAKVETELFRPADAPKGRVTIGVADGVVELRGTADTDRQIRDLERRARELPEVRDVENLLHHPKTPAPTRGDAQALARKQSARSGTPERPVPGGQQPTPGTDERAVPRSRRPAPAPPERPAPASADVPGGQRPVPGTDRSAASAGERSAPGTGERPVPRASVPLRHVGAPGITRSDLTHPRADDVLGVLARRADLGDRVNQAEICKELGLDATQVAEALRTLSTTNLISRPSTGNWELTPAGEREVEPKKPGLQPREPQAR